MRFLLSYLTKKSEHKFISHKAIIYAKNIEICNEIAYKIIPKKGHVYNLGLYWCPDRKELNDKNLLLKPNICISPWIPEDIALEVLKECGKNPKCTLIAVDWANRSMIGA